jgi:hypothetical protein
VGAKHSADFLGKKTPDQEAIAMLHQRLAKDQQAPAVWEPRQFQLANWYYVKMFPG